MFLTFNCLSHIPQADPDRQLFKLTPVAGVLCSLSNRPPSLFNALLLAVLAVYAVNYGALHFAEFFMLCGQAGAESCPFLQDTAAEDAGIGSWRLSLATWPIRKQKKNSFDVVIVGLCKEDLDTPSSHPECDFIRQLADFARSRDGHFRKFSKNTQPRKLGV
ncbi:unnamed protein product [Protopolystoma xenopodis]|uniref:Uncharacterized protein n=1 Tax=Protopolystoma xenopodis TaxID=117903 RepID=A0A448XQT9_9PLAT|nr:unnamed protein product [Protopolystoma xenopodis]